MTAESLFSLACAAVLRGWLLVYSIIRTTVNRQPFLDDAN